jgi:hypothetical protein
MPVVIDLLSRRVWMPAPPSGKIVIVIHSSSDED